MVGLWRAQVEGDIAKQYKFRLSAKTKLYTATDAVMSNKITLDNKPTETGQIAVSQYQNTVTVIELQFVPQRREPITGIQRSLSM